jgi:hypothetical protein
MPRAEASIQASLSVSGAFTNSKNASTPLVLTHYCRLSIQSPDAIWHSRIINAIICPQLHTDLILGLDFLVRNKIVVDAELRTVIAKESGYDLLNPPDPKLHRHNTQKSPHQRCKLEAQQIKAGQTSARKTRILVHMELMALFDENEQQFDMSPFTTGPLDIMATIKTRIAQLAGEATLRKLDTQMKESFVDHFPSDIPHVKDLPRNVYHHIQLLPGAPVSVSRAYGCPHKYRTGWKTLIDQHVAAGRIRPSLSPYASPSFIIPKADPTVLPRWVNDYRHLNRLTVPDNYPLPRIDDILADCAKGKNLG